MASDVEVWMQAGRILDARMDTISGAKFGEKSDVMVTPREDNVRAMVYGDLINMELMTVYSEEQAKSIIKISEVTEIPLEGLIGAAIEGAIAMGIKFEQLRQQLSDADA